MVANSGGLTSSLGNTTEAELSGEGGLLLSSLRVDRLSKDGGASAKQVDGDISGEPLWTLCGLKPEVGYEGSEGSGRSAWDYLMSAEKLPVASLL